MFGVAIIQQLILAVNQMSCEAVLEVNYDGIILLKNEWKEGETELYMEFPGILENPIDCQRLTGLKDIKRITIVGCDNFTGFPEWIKSLENLNALIFYGCRFEDSPTWIGELKSLGTLFIKYCGLKKVPDTIGNLTDLKNLDLSQNRLNMIPGFIPNLKKLQYLSLYSNSISELPKWISDLKDKVHINLAKNSPELTLPDWIEKDSKMNSLFEDMTDLCLNYYNKFRVDPEEFALTRSNRFKDSSDYVYLRGPKYYIGLYLKAVSPKPSNEIVDVALDIMGECLKNQRGWSECTCRLTDYFQSVISSTNPTTA